MCDEKKSLTKFDAELDVLHNEGILACAPWIGQEYENFRIMVIAESHYSPTTKIQKDSQCYPRTREVIAEYPIMGTKFLWNERRNPTIDNIMRVLVPGFPLHIDEQRPKLWHRVAYMNIIQRPMNSDSKERPNAKDFRNGWTAVLRTLEILQPQLCIFAGLTAANFFNDAMKKEGVEYSPVVYHAARINRCCPRSASVKINGGEIALRFMRHPGSFFSCKPWHDFVYEGQGELELKIGTF